MPLTLDDISNDISTLREQVRQQSLQKAIKRLHIVNIELGASANAEKEYRLPPGTKMFIFQCRDATAFRVSFKRGVVAGSQTGDPGYLTIKANSAWVVDNIDLEPGIEEETFIYFACSTASKVIEGVIGR